MYLKNEKGAALLFVIIIFSVLMVFASAMISVWGAEGMTAVRQEKQVKARYSAQSAADSVAKFIADANNSDDPFVLAIKGLTSDESLSTNAVSNNPMTKASLNVTVKKLSNKNIEVYAKSSVGGVSENVTLVMTGGDIDSDIIFDGLIDAGETLNSKGFTSIVGDVNYGDTLIGNPPFNDLSHIEGDVTNESIDYAEPELPEINDVHAGTVSTKNYSNMNGFNGDKIDKLVTKQNNPVKFDKDPGGNDKIWTLVIANKLDVNDGFDIPVGDMLIIYIMPGGSADITIPNNYTVNDSNQLLIMAMAGSTVTIQANAEFNGFIYGPSADVSVKTVHVAFKGAVITNNFNTLGNSATNAMMTYEEFDDDLFDWSYYLESNYTKAYWER
ncbi:MAG: hypothetical protein U9Q80_00785 [Bacillota bacterium]|nr:hypothetical protein [Bacillota bacterium]